MCIFIYMVELELCLPTMVFLSVYTIMLAFNVEQPEISKVKSCIQELVLGLAEISLGSLNL